MAARAALHSGSSLGRAGRPVTAQASNNFLSGILNCTIYWLALASCWHAPAYQRFWVTKVPKSLMIPQQAAVVTAKLHGAEGNLPMHANIFTHISTCNRMNKDMYMHIDIGVSFAFLAFFVQRGSLSKQKVQVHRINPCGSQLRITLAHGHFAPRSAAIRKSELDAPILSATAVSY